jgi:ribose transport system ATP-binding protein
VRSASHTDSGAALVVEHLASTPALKDASFTLRKGEILGVAGLHGHGQKELFMALFGARSSKGSITIDGKPVRLRGPHDAIAARIGISLVPEERKTEGLMIAQAGLPNLTLPSLSQFSAGGFVRRRKERAAAASVLRRVNAVPRALDRPVSTLSGGNQQKIAIGKWLLSGARILLMYDPTRGVDVETKAEIFSLMQQLADQGRSILFYSTDVEELVNVADRTVVMYRGSTSRELTGDAATMESIVEAMLGHSVAVSA